MYDSTTSNMNNRPSKAPLYIFGTLALAFFAMGFVLPLGDTIFDALFPKEASDAASPAKLQTDLTIVATLGQSVDVPVQLIAPNSNVVAVDVVMRFDPTALTLEDIQENTVLGYTLVQNDTIAVMNQNGLISFGVAVFDEANMAPLPAFNGELDHSNPLATLVFTPLNQGSTELQFVVNDNEALQTDAHVSAVFNEDAENTLTLATGGLIRISAPDPQPIPTNTPIPTVHIDPDPSPTDVPIEPTQPEPSPTTEPTPTLHIDPTVQPTVVPTEPPYPTPFPTFTPVPTTPPSPTIAPTDKVTPTIMPSPTFAPPAPNQPMLNDIVQPTYKSTVDLSGTKDAETYIVINNNLIDSQYASTSFSIPLALEVGENTFIVNAENTYSLSSTPQIVYIERRELGDINGDQKVNVFDLGILVSNYREKGINNSSETKLRLSDLNADGQVSAADIGLFIREADFRRFYRLNRRTR